MRAVVGVLRGGPSSEYEVSLKSGAAVLEHLDKEKYQPLDVYISRSGQWHKHGIEVEPHQALRGVDVAFNVLHGAYGEDGSIHKLLDSHGLRYTGSHAFQSAIAFNKALTKKALAPEGITMARHVILREMPDLDTKIFELFRTFPQPSIIKPATSGSSVGVTLARSFDSFADAIHTAFTYAPTVLVEEYIKGREATVGVLEDFRGEELYSLFPVEIIPPPKNDFFDYDAKYSGETQEICPGRFSREESEELQRVARLVHKTLELRHYSRSDFIVSPRGIYFLEANNAAAVGFTEQSLFPKTSAAAGLSFPQLLDHIVSLALNRN